MSELVLNADQLQFSIKKRNLLKGVRFSVTRGKTFAVVGHNGAGKTTLFHLILGLKIQTGGTIELFGKSNLDFKSREKIGYVPERPYLNLEMTLQGLLIYHAKLMGLASGFTKDEVKRVANEVGLQNHLHQALSTFSKGMLQKSLLAQARLGHPELYIMDEPMSGLDPEAREEVRQQIQKLKKEGRTIIFSSHALEDVEQLADEVLILKEGSVNFLGTVTEWKANR